MDIITPAEMYWILKLDDILDAVQALGICFTVFAIVVTIARLIMCGPLREDMPLEVCSATRKASRILIAISSIFIIASALLPTTKQYAAIKVIPLILNSDAVKTVAADAKDLYALGIQGLKEALTKQTEAKQ